MPFAASFDLYIFEVLPDEFLKTGQALKAIPSSLPVSGSSRAGPTVIGGAAQVRSEAGVGLVTTNIWTDADSSCF